VEFRPAKRRDVWESIANDLVIGQSEAPAWLEGLHRDKVFAVMVYRDSAEDIVLGGSGSGYVITYQQPESEGRFVVRIYTRRDDKPPPR